MGTDVYFIVCNSLDLGGFVPQSVSFNQRESEEIARKSVFLTCAGLM